MVQQPSILSVSPPLFDISQLAPDDRAFAWKGRVASIFPGVSLENLSSVPQGEIQLVQLGSGSLWSVRSSAATVRYRPCGSAQSSHVSLMLQASGTTRLSQGGRRCDVLEGEISLLDEEEPFVLSGSASSEILFVRMPRAAVVSRHPGLLRKTAVAMDNRQAGSRLVQTALMNMIAALPHLTDRQRGSALVGLVHMLGVLEPDADIAASGWRVQAALDFIELNFSNSDLKAGDVALAQRISRRRLDSILVRATGLSLTAHIWNRRIEQSAQDLRDPGRATLSVSQVGYANGFNHPAHFARVFKERYGSSPLQFRSAP